LVAACPGLQIHYDSGRGLQRVVHVHFSIARTINVSLTPENQHVEVAGIRKTPKNAKNVNPAIC